MLNQVGDAARRIYATRMPFVAVFTAFFRKAPLPQSFEGDELIDMACCWLTTQINFGDALLPPQIPNGLGVSTNTHSSYC